MNILIGIKSPMINKTTFLPELSCYDNFSELITNSELTNDCRHVLDFIVWEVFYSNFEIDSIHKRLYFFLAILLILGIC